MIAVPTSAALLRLETIVLRNEVMLAPSTVLSSADRRFAQLKTSGERPARFQLNDSMGFIKEVF